MEVTDASDGGDVALHAYVLMLESMAWRRAKGAPGRRAPNSVFRFCKCTTPTPPSEQ